MLKLTHKKSVATLTQPHLVELFELLEELERLQQADPCSGFEVEYGKAPEDVCSEIDAWWGDTGKWKCFQCVFEHYGLELPNFGDLPYVMQVRRFRELLGAYRHIDDRLRALLNGCEDGQRLETSSVIDYLLGEGLLTLQYDPNIEDDAFAYADGTQTIIIPERQFRIFEQGGIQVGDPDYQTIAFLLAHDLGHIFHNRVQDVIYQGQVNEPVRLTMPDGTERVVNLPLGTPRAVRDYLQAVGGYYIEPGLENRDFNFPAAYDYAAEPLTSLNFNGPGQPLEIYEPNGRTIRSEVKTQLDDLQINIHIQNSSGKEFVYLRRDGIFVNENDRVRFIEANTYLPSDVPSALIPAFPNERRATAEPKEGFADSFAAYLLELPGFAETSRFEYFDQRMQNWLCQLLEAGSATS